MKRLALIGAAAMAVACGGSTSSPSVVTTPAATVTTETFTGTVQPPINGVLQIDVHTFTVTTPGTISVTMTAAGPPATIAMGIGIGNPSPTGSCVFLSGGVNSSAVASTTTPHLSGAVTASGAYCVAVGDIGTVLQTVTYTVTVSHT
jgi:hypothetical protein